MARPEWHRADTLLRGGSSGRRGEGSWGLGTVTLISNYKTENSNCKLLQKAKREEDKQANGLALAHSIPLSLLFSLLLSLSF